MISYQLFHVKIRLDLKNEQYTGWGAQSWTVFCGPAAVAIAVSGKISEIR
jgi:hypothetical protein